VGAASAWSSRTAFTIPAGARSSASTSARTETEAFWTEFLRGLVARGLVGVQLVIPTPTPASKAAIARVLGGAPWQRCTVHFLRDCLGQARRDQHGLWSSPAFVDT
jgi:transposase-like protein